MSEAFSLNVNGSSYDVSAPGPTVLTEVLRNELGLKGTKVGCGSGDCGACTVLVDGEAHCACLLPVGRLEGRSILTVEGLADDELGARLQASFLRHGAAQCGFCTPGMLMAARSLVGQNPTPTADEVEKALGGVLCRCTGYRSIIEAVLGYSAEPEIEVAPVGKAVGASISRVDGIERVSGSAVYGADAIPRDALTIRIIRSPYARARFVMGDLDGYVQSRPDVCAVLTCADVTGINRFGVIPGFVDQAVFAEEVTRFAGEAVAAVVFEPETDFSLDGFPIEWQELPALESMVDAMAEGSPLIHEDHLGNILIEGHVQRGDVEHALESSDAVASGVFTTPFVEHAYIEPEAGWAEVIGDVVVIHVTTQTAYMDQASTAAILGVADDMVRVVPTEVGGGFGGKLDVSVQPYLALAAKQLRRSVQITYDRRESMMSTTKRHPSRLNVRIGANREGFVTGVDFEGTFNTGAYASWGPTVANRVPVHASGPYFVPHYRAHTRAVLTNVQPSGAFRGFGVPQATIAQEVLLDDLAYDLDFDRLEFRIQNALTVGQTTVTGQLLEASVGIRDCLLALRDPWVEANAAIDRERAESGPSRYRSGVGVASIWYGCGNTSLSNPSTFKAGITPDGRVMLHQGAIDIGQGSSTVITQIFADALAVDVGSVLRVSGDTLLTPDAGKTSASRQTYVSGMAAMLVGKSLRRQLLDLLGAPEDASLNFDGGNVSATVGDRVVSLDLSSMPVEGGYVVQATDTFDPPTKPLDSMGQGVPYAVYGFGAQLVELTVDTYTGLVALKRITAAYDVGRAINPMLVVGQIEGGIAQGIGLALMESYIPGLTNNLHDYLIPTIGDVPEIRSILIESNDPGGPYGAKGVGEHTIIGTAPAVLNAIRHATGARVTDVPATPERVLRAIGDAR